MKGLTAMYEYHSKKWSILLSAIGLAGMIGERTKGFILFKKLNADQHYAMFEWLMLGGLFILIFCKEKYDDDRTKAIRLRSFHIAFLIQQSTLLSMALTGSLAQNMEQLPYNMLFMFSAIGIILYLLIFHIGLYFDFLWEYDDKSVWENLKSINKNKWGILAYLVAGTIMLILVTLMEK